MARLDTGWHANPKVLQVGLQAMGMHAWSISYCDHALTDGFIPSGAWPALAGAGAAVKALLVAGLWERADGGFRLHDYTDYNRTRAQVEDYMAAKTAAGRAGGQASAQARASANGRPPAQASAQANGNEMLKQNPTPGPGPGPGDVRSSVRTVRTGYNPGAAGSLSARAREGLPDEVLARLDQPPLHTNGRGLAVNERTDERTKISSKTEMAG